VPSDSSQFTIVHEEPSLRFRYGDGGENVFYTDGRMTEDLEAGLLEARASWKKGKRIEIQRDSPQGGAITEKYQLSDDGSQPLRWHHIVPLPLALAWTTTGLWAESLQFYQSSTQARHRSTKPVLSV